LTGLNLSLAEAAGAMGARNRTGLTGVILAGVGTDSRKIGPGELFVALKGPNFDGHAFVGQAFEAGAAAAVIADSERSVRGKICLRVPDTLKALGDLAALVRRRRPLKVVALTGSNGKTTTKEMLIRIIGRKYNTLATQGNLNNLIGLPLTLFGLRNGHQAAVLEMGMNRPGEIARLTEIADPDVGLVTNVGPAHLEGLRDLDGVTRAKGEIYAGLRKEAVAVVNLDDPLAAGAASVFPGRRLTFGFKPPAEVRVRGLRRRSLTGTDFELMTPEGAAKIRFALLGRHNVANALAASGAALALGLSPADIRAGLEGFRPFPGRLELKRLPGPVYLIDDTYNANPASTRAALEVLTDLKGKGRAVAVLGDMLELGSTAETEHQSVGRTAARLGVDVLITVGPNAKIMSQAARKEAGAPTEIFWFPDVSPAADFLGRRIQAYDRILVKGSRSMRMERIVHFFTGEGRGD